MSTDQPDPASAPSDPSAHEGSHTATPTTGAAPGQPHRRRLWPWLVGLGCLIVAALSILALVLGGTGIWLLSGHHDESSSSASSSATALPRGVKADQPYIQFGDGAQSDKRVDVYLDFLCPYCKQFSEANADDLQAMSTQDDMTVRIHVRPMLDQSTSPAGYSGRAANAALCVYDEKPENYWAMEKTLYANQPEENSAGLPDAKLVQFAHDSGASSTVDSCITSHRFVPYVENVVEPEARSKDYGTPMVEINGKVHQGDDLYTPGSLKAAVDAG